MALNAISFLVSSGGHTVQWRGTVCATSVEGIMENICVKLFPFWSGG